MNLICSGIRIETERLVLRPLEAQDEKTFISFLTDPDFMQYSRAGAFNSTDARSSFIKRLEQSGNPYTKLAVTQKATGQLIGYCGVEPFELDGKIELELGYRLTANARGHGYATEAARAVLDYYQQRGIINIIAFTAYGNKPSQAVLKKLGYKRVKTGEIESFPIVIFRR